MTRDDELLAMEIGVKVGETTALLASTNCAEIAPLKLMFEVITQLFQQGDKNDWDLLSAKLLEFCSEMEKKYELQ